jgi:aminoglycoside phosphotransferase (APT) family kinase protein
MSDGGPPYALDKLEIPPTLVSRLIAAQFPQWAGLPVRPVDDGGWDNVTFRLGDALSVRLPSAERYAAAVDKEHHWLPVLAGHLPLPIPLPVARGAPGHGFPWPWSIRRWLHGHRPTVARIVHPVRFAAELAEFLVALHRIDAASGPPPGAHNFFRGGPLAVYDSETRAALVALGDDIDVNAATAVWDAALAATWTGPPVWVHGDFSAANLLVDDAGVLSAVLDFGGAAVGDPACDVVIAWTFLEGEGRLAFRDRLPVDAATWARGRGWALWKALITLARRDAGEAATAHRVLREVLAVQRG